MNFKVIKLGDDFAQRVHMLETNIFPDPYSKEALKKDLSSFSVICLGAVSDTELCGYCICTSVLDEAELLRIAVSPDCRKKGIASALIKQLIDECDNRNINNIYLEVRSSNTGARRLYEKFNFIKTGCRKAYYSDNGEDAILYTRFTDRR